MAKIWLKTLTCIETTGGGSDDTYAKFIVDGKYHSRWPDRRYREMDENDTASIDRQIEFNRALKVELWEYDSGSGDDYMGRCVFPKTPKRKSGSETIANPSEGDVYHLKYEYLPPEKIRTVRLRSAKCVKVSSATDQSVINAALDLSADAAQAAGESLGWNPDPRAQVLGTALEAGAKVLRGAKGLTAAIADAGEYPDQLYMTRTNQPGLENRFWPAIQYYEIRTGQVVRFEDLRLPLTRGVDINLWEYDSGSGDDLLGTLSVEPSVKDGIHFTTVARPSEGSIYFFAYQVGEEEW